MKIMVTGNLGYIGTVLTAILRQRGDKVIGIDNDLFSQCTIGNQNPENVLTLRKDIRDVNIKDFQGVETVCHLAGLPNDPCGDLNPLLMEEINYHASMRLAEMAKTAGVKRFIFSSSCSCYSHGPHTLLQENSPCNPITAYDRAKLDTEKDLMELADENFSPVILRCAEAYGFSPKMRFDLQVNNMTALAYTAETVELKSNDCSWRPIVHVIDIAHAFCKASEANKALVHNRIFNVGITEDNVQLHDIAKMISEIMPEYQLSYTDNAFTDNNNFRVNCDLIQEHLDFKGSWNMLSGIRQLCNAYEYYDLDYDIYEDIRFRRVDWINNMIENNLVDSHLRVIPQQNPTQAKEVEYVKF
ncbi:MAG: SDR family oxidoreductase [Phycisphaerae bacterium]|nr:SDR family oxidoreductase [Phycisphaerae bacterium]